MVEKDEGFLETSNPDSSDHHETEAGERTPSEFGRRTFTN